MYTPFAKSNPPESGISPGGLLCLLSLVVSIKPLADEVASHTCYDRHQYCDDVVHRFTPPFRCQYRGGSVASISLFDKFRKGGGAMGQKPKKTNGLLRTRVYLGRDENGKPRYKALYAHTRAELAQKEAQLRVKLGKGLNAMPERNRFSLWAGDFLRLKEASQISEGQKDRYRTAVKYWTSTFDGWSIQDIGPDDLERALLSLAESGLAQRTVNFYRSAIRQILQRAQGRVITENPERHLTREMASIGKPAVQRRALTAEEQRWFWNTPHRAQPVAIIMMLSGLRRGELAALTWEDVDLKEATITVNKTMIYDGAGIPHLKPCTKTTAGMRVIDIPAKLVDYMKTMPHSGDLVFPAASGGPMTASAWVKLWSSYMRELNIKYGERTEEDKKRAESPKPGPKTYDMTIPPITLHWLRHTYCTLLYFAGVDVLQACAQMGHADVSTTLRIYTHLDQTHKRQAADKLQAYLTGEKKESARG